VDSFKSYHYFRPPYVSEAPPRRVPDVETKSKWFCEVWVRYPHDPKEYPINLAHSMKALCALRVIVHEICTVSFRADRPPMKMPWAHALDLQARLKNWYETLPAALSTRLLLYPSHIKLQ
jgi:hypothetical protein